MYAFSVPKAREAMLAADLEMTTRGSDSPVSQTVILIVDGTDPEPGTSVVEGTTVAVYVKSEH
jgi:hypothetical protein